MSAFVVRSGRTTALATRHFHTGLARAGGALNQPVPWNYLWKPGPYPETESAMNRYIIIWMLHQIFMYSDKVILAAG